MDTRFGTVRITDIDPSEAEHLTSEAQALFQSLYPEVSNHLVVDEDLRKDNAVFLGAHLGNKPVGCVGFIPGSSDNAREVKRLFVEEGYRGAGIAGALMDTVEEQAIAQGATLMQLETGISQPEAISLFEKRGYRIVPAFGAYIEDEFSVFMEKNLVP